MAHLAIRVLGPFEVALDGKPIARFRSNKVRALLAYLAVEADHAHPRGTLAALLWPDHPHTAALSNLRNALSNLRRVLSASNADPPFLLVTRATIRFNPASDHWLDVAAFGDAVSASQPDRNRVQQALTSVRGPFVQGLSTGDSDLFEDWALLQQSRICQQMLGALSWLAGDHERRGEYGPACNCVRRQLELEPWDEEYHREMMRLLALGGRRSAALAQYETCRRLLAKELGFEPESRTQALYKCIRDGRLGDWEIGEAGTPVIWTNRSASVSTE